MANENRRLLNEFKSLQQEPVPYITAYPEESNILLWYFLIEGPKDSPYEGGCYLGKLRFPKEYPFAPPSIMFCTPNGRFKTETRICTSMSDFHPKEWTPSWGPRTILTGLLSFMLENQQTYGSMETSNEYKKKAALETHSYNLSHPAFMKTFPEKAVACQKHVEEIENRKRKEREEEEIVVEDSGEEEVNGEETRQEEGVRTSNQKIRKVKNSHKKKRSFNPLISSLFGNSIVLKTLQFVLLALIAITFAYVMGR